MPIPLILGIAAKTLLPWLAAAVAGPLKDTALEFAKEKLGLEEGTVDSINKFIAGATPDDLLKAKNADQEFQLKMKELGFKEVYDIEELAVRDRESAREREIKTGDKTTSILAWIYTFGYFCIVGYAFAGTIEPANNDIVMALMGILSAAQLGIIQYYFGSSAGSAAKNNALFDAMRK
ncbi:MAG: hypothetical protein AM326_09295 [Candidatus Thorarchaeota archaeon SMTZ-45]|nr:MAG: hypothetical protein AM326_09295 [Candidatus Thorarchaeota archaeon SMTZ-45]